MSWIPTFASSRCGRCTGNIAGCVMHLASRQRRCMLRSGRFYGKIGICVLVATLHPRFCIGPLERNVLLGTCPHRCFVQRRCKNCIRLPKKCSGCHFADVRQWGLVRCLNLLFLWIVFVETLLWRARLAWLELWLIEYNEYFIMFVSGNDCVQLKHVLCEKSRTVIVCNKVWIWRKNRIRIQITSLHILFFHKDVNPILLQNKG